MSVQRANLDDSECFETILCTKICIFSIYEDDKQTKNETVTIKQRTLFEFHVTWMREMQLLARRTFVR